MMRRQILTLATAALSGILFGAGLYVSQMTDPLKVLRFLDITAVTQGGWDPSLGFVIVPAILVTAIALRLSKLRRKPLFDGSFHNPRQNRIDLRLLIGAALFGMGWGMSGLCPGPAIAVTSLAPEGIWIFLVAMFAGTLAASVVLPQKPGTHS